MCPAGYRQGSAGPTDDNPSGCTACDKGEFQSEAGFAGRTCEACPALTYMPEQNASACLPCPKPFCAAAVLACDPVLGFADEAGAFSTWLAHTVVCRAADASDPCAKPAYCRDDVPQCEAGNASYPMDFTLPPCAGDPAHGVHCWGDVTYLATPSNLTVHWPAPPGGATCNARPVTPRVQYILAHGSGAAAHAFTASDACRPNAALYHLPDGGGANSWWEDAQLSALSPHGTSPLLPAGTPYTMPLDATLLDTLQGQVVHVIAQLYEPYKDLIVGHACLARIVVDSSPPVTGQGSSHRAPCTPHCILCALVSLWRAPHRVCATGGGYLAVPHPACRGSARSDGGPRRTRPHGGPVLLRVGRPLDALPAE